MNIDKLSKSTSNQPRKRTDPNAESQIVLEKKKVTSFEDLTEEDYKLLLRDRDTLAEELIFIRTSSQYTSHCYELLQKYENYAEKFLRELDANYEAGTKASAIVQEAIMEEMDVG